MKKKKTRIILCIVLLLVVTAALILVKQLTKEKKETKKKVQPVSQTEVKDIEGLIYRSESTGGEEVSFVRDKDIWYYEKDKEFPLDQSYVTNNMVLTAAQATANRTLENPSGNLSEYGLDNPHTTITLKKITGDKVTMHIGSYNENVEGYYLKVEGDDRIYLVDGQMVFAFDMSIYEIADKEDFPLVEESSFAHIHIQKDKRVLELKGEIKENTPKHVTKDSYMEQEKTWSVSDNGTAYREGNQQAIKELIAKMTAFDYSKMIAYRADVDEKKQYGLDEEHAVILTVDYQVLDETTARQVEVADGITEIQCDTLDKQYVLYIGQEIPDDGFDGAEYYVCMKDSDVIYTISAESLADIVLMDAKKLK